METPSGRRPRPPQDADMTRILIADDHPVVRAGIRQYLEADPGVREIGEAATGRETLDRLRAQAWDLVLLDIFMPDRSGLDILRHIQSGFPTVRVLVLSALPEKQYALSVLRAGASGYLAKDSAPEELLKAIHTVLRAGAASAPRWLNCWLRASTTIPTARSTHGCRRANSRCSPNLPPAVRFPRLPAELLLSVKTVSTYRNRVLEKMGFKTNADLTSYALRNGLIQ